MSLETVRAFLARHAPELEVTVTEASSATVADAAAAYGVALGQIAKTLTLKTAAGVVLLVARGDARLDNRKAKSQFGKKLSMVEASEVERITGHPLGGVTPFGLALPLPVYCDVSLKAFDEVIPAAGSGNSAVRISPARLAEITGAQWVDCCEGPVPAGDALPYSGDALAGLRPGDQEPNRGEQT